MPSRSSSVCNDVWRWGSAPPLDTAFLSSTETGAGFKRPTFMRVLISGAGIAGPTLAYWLAHYGFTPTIVEKAPRLRTGGYIIDFGERVLRSRIEWVFCRRSAARATRSKS